MRMIKRQTQRDPRTLRFGIWISGFELPSDFVLRISDLIYFLTP